MALTKDQVSDLYSLIDAAMQRRLEQEQAIRAYEEASHKLRYFISQQTKEPDKA